jgi:hypothetical protein
VTPRAGSLASGMRSQAEAGKLHDWDKYESMRVIRPSSLLRASSPKDRRRASGSCDWRALLPSTGGEPLTAEAA